MQYEFDPILNRTEPKDDRFRPVRYPSKIGLRSVLGCLGLVIVFGCCGGGIFFSILAYTTYQNHSPNIQAAADNFFNLLQQDRLPEAYATTSTHYKSAQTEAQFRAFVSRFPMLTGHKTRNTTGLRINTTPQGTTAQLQATLQSLNSAMSCSLILVPDGQEWKVAAIVVP